MGFEIDLRQPSLGTDLRRVALDQISGALEELASGGKDLPEQIHRLRKRTKKLRSLVRVIGKPIPGHRAELMALRDMARRLAGLRDAEVMLATFDTLGASADSLRNRLIHNRALSYADTTLQSRLEEVQREMTALQRRVERWHLKPKGFALLAPGIGRTWAQCHTRLDAARKAPVTEAIHDLRKRVKDHFYQARLLQPLWPEGMALHVNQAMHLEEQLGQVHDLDVLTDWLHQQTDSADTAATVALALGRRTALAQDSLLLGYRLFAGSADDLVLRWSSWWLLAQSEPKPASLPAPAKSSGTGQPDALARQFRLDQGNGLAHPVKRDKPAKPRPL
jgi:CHAD domain-containing protein